MDSFLIRATNWIGDSIMSLPAIKELRRLHPGASISVLARHWVADIYRVGNWVDEVIVMDRAPWPGLRGLLHTARELRRRRFHCALLLQNAFEAALIARLARIPVRIGYNTDHRGFLLTCPIALQPNVLAMHQNFYYLNLLTASRLSPRQYGPGLGYQPDATLQLSDEQKLAAQKLLESLKICARTPLVGLNPGAAYGPAKRWFPERYAAVADYLIDRWDAQVVVIGSAAETGIARQVQKSMRHSAILLSGRTTLLELMGLIEQCDLFLTNDSGPMHLAAALGRPLIALFGSTDERATGPVSDRAHVVHKPVDCTPCFLRSCPIDLRCFKQISVDEVCRLADAILQGVTTAAPSSSAGS
ncbi:MAG: lipopolysaccharide heptosyltransferase II [Acidobacteria bacterium]|nr:lipopolysaccharide heptosyltransferase II [Acidobacteriota bacterium]